MVSTSNSDVQQLFIPAHRGTLLVLSKFPGGRKRAVLIIPGHRQTAADTVYRRVAHLVTTIDTSVYIMDIRGHGKSEGRWDAAAHKKDVQAVLSLLHKSFSSVYALASDVSATELLESDLESSLSGMLLLHPSTLSHPVRIQTPTVIFSHSHDATLLKRVFGPVQVQIVPKGGGASQDLQQVDQICKSLQQLFASEKPIRFMRNSR